MLVPTMLVPTLRLVRTPGDWLHNGNFMGIMGIPSSIGLPGMKKEIEDIEADTQIKYAISAVDYINE